MGTYPKREKFFANRFIRLLVKCCVANEIGTDAFALLTTIVMTEDASHYRRGVFFYDEQLKPLLGIKGNSTMTLIRKKAIEAGWLHFKPGHRGKASIYWVTIPNHANGLDDNPTDEGHDTTLVPKIEPNQGLVRDQIGIGSGLDRDANGALLPIPIPNPTPAGSVPVTREEKAADLANHYWVEATGRRRLSQEDLRVEFAEKLRVYGDSRYELILTKIKDKGRDRTQHLWQFWKLCSIESQPPRPDTIYLTADEIEAETMRRQREHDERRKNAAPRPGTRENAGQPGHAVA